MQAVGSDGVQLLSDLQNCIWIDLVLHLVDSGARRVCCSHPQMFQSLFCKELRIESRDVDREQATEDLSGPVADCPSGQPFEPDCPITVTRKLTALNQELVGELYDTALVWIREHQIGPQCLAETIHDFWTPDSESDCSVKRDHLDTTAGPSARN